jgi:hypothetical protein
MNRALIVRNPFVFAVLGLSFAFAGASLAAAAGPVWDSLIPFKKIDADPSNPYQITQSNGPWMIMAMTFRGDKATEEAHQLVYEFRSKYKLPAYSYEKTFDFSQPVQGRGVDAQGRPLVGKYQASVIKEVAVLVGDYDTVDDANAQKVLAKIKTIEPDCLKSSQAKDAESTDAFRQFQKSITGQDKNKKGPMSHALIATNPLLPREFFASRGVDKFVLEMNKGVENSLLDCKGKYTIRVATFKGSALIDQKKIRDVEKGHPMESHLAAAAEKAAVLTADLRKKGWEAYEFHDRESSIVCVGHFEAVGTPNGQGGVNVDPDVQKIVDTFKAGQDTRPVPELAPGQAIKPKYLDNIAFDIQPTVIEVPKRSIGADYQRSMRQERP